MSGLDLDLLFTKANLELEKASTWFRANKLTLNVSKTKLMLFSDKDINLNALGLKLKIGDSDIVQVGSKCKEKYFGFVGHVLDDKLSGQGNVQHICKKLASANFAINSTKHFIPFKIRKITVLYNV